MVTASVGFPVAVQRVAVISFHTSPLAQPGSGDSGGMNVYVRELVSALSHAGVECTTYTRRTVLTSPRSCRSSPATAWCTCPPARYDLAKEQLPSVLTEFGDRVIDHLKNDSPADVVHANYFLSGLVAHRIKHELDLPFVSTFHTLAKVKAEGGDHEPEWRHRAEHRDHQLRGRHLRQLQRGGEPVPAPLRQSPRPHRDRRAWRRARLLRAGRSGGARNALGLPLDAPVLLFVGRIQPLKSPDLAVRALAQLGRPDALLLIVGGASGAEGDQRGRASAAAHRRTRRAPGRCSSCRRSRTTFSAPTTAPPTRSSCPAAVRASAWSRSRRPPAVCPSWRRCRRSAHPRRPRRNRLPRARRATRRCSPTTCEIIDHPSTPRRWAPAAAERATRYTWGSPPPGCARLYNDLTGARELVACG
jgi:hypothetical protein